MSERVLTETEERLKLAIIESEINRQQVEKYKRALNRIAIIGSGEKAYTSDFTNEVMGIVREVLNEN